MNKIYKTILNRITGEICGVSDFNGRNSELMTLDVKREDSGLGLKCIGAVLSVFNLKNRHSDEERKFVVGRSCRSSAQENQRSNNIDIESNDFGEFGGVTEYECFGQGCINSANGNIINLIKENPYLNFSEFLARNNSGFFNQTNNNSVNIFVGRNELYSICGEHTKINVESKSGADKINKFCNYNQITW